MVNNKNTVKKSEIYTHYLNCVKFLRVTFFVYSFLAFAGWFVQSMGFTSKANENSSILKIFFDYLFFFKKEVTSGIDFTLILIGSFAILLGFFMDYIINNLYQKIDILQEEEANELMIKKMEREKAKERRKQKEEIQKRQMEQAQDNSIFEMPTVDLVQNVKSLRYVDLDNINLLFLIEPRIVKIKKKAEDLDLTFEKLEIWKKRINKSILDAIIYSRPLQKGFYRKNLFLIYKSFNYVDDFIYFIKPALNAIILEYRKYGISVSFCYVLSALINIDFLEQELDCMDTVFSLDFYNTFIATHSFKATYDNKKGHRYSISLKGEYNLSKNLTITNIQPLYELNERII